MTQNQIDEVKIRDAAYQIWIDEGQPNGRDEAHWLMALESLSEAPAKKPARKSAAKPRAAAKTGSKAAAKPKAAAKAKPKAKAAAKPKAATK